MSDYLTFGVALKSTSDGSVTADVKSARDEMDKLKQSTDELAAASAKAASGLDEDWAVVQKRLNDTAIADDNARAKAWALASGYKEVGGQMVRASEDIAEGADKAARGSAGITRELVVMGHEAISGNFSRIPGSMMVLAERMGGINEMLGPLGIGLGVVTAAVVAGGYAWYEWATAVDHASDSALKAEEAARNAAIAAARGVQKTSEEKLHDLQLQIEYAENSLVIAERKRNESTFKSKSAERDALDMAVIDRRNALIALERQVDQVQAQVDAPAEADYKKQEEAQKKLLADAKRFDDAALESHKDALDKWVDEWKRQEDELTALGSAGAARRAANEATYTVYINAENDKRNADAAAAAKKKDDAEAAHMVSVLGAEHNYFARLQAMADDAELTSGGREKLRFDRELIALNAEHAKTAALVKGDRDKALAEEAAYQTALANLKKAYALQNFQEDATVHAVGLAFTEQNHEAEITSTLAYFEKLSSFGASHHRAMFEINKIASMAVTAMNTAKGVSGVLAEFPGPVGWGMAAAQAALGIAQEVAISETQFGGGGVSSGGGGIPSMATSPGIPVSIQPPSPMTIAPQAPQQLNITVIGAKDNPDKAVLSFNALVDIVNGINRVGQNGHRINASVISA